MRPKYGNRINLASQSCDMCSPNFSYCMEDSGRHCRCKTPRTSVLSIPERPANPSRVGQLYRVAQIYFECTSTVRIKASSSMAGYFPSASLSSVSQRMSHCRITPYFFVKNSKNSVFGYLFARAPPCLDVPLGRTTEQKKSSCIYIIVCRACES
jgi:hypothetical protein